MSATFAAPRATWTVLRLIWMQVLLSVAVMLERSLFHGHKITDYFALSYEGFFVQGRIWQVLTTTLIDLDPIALLFNSLMLWMFGSELEQRWGRSLFTRFFLICGLGATTGFLFLSWLFPETRFFPYLTPTGPMLGLLLAYAVYWPDRQVWVMFIFPVRIKYLLLFMGLIEIVYALTRSISPIIVGGHLGGLIAAGIVLLISGGELSKLDRPFERLGDFFGSWNKKNPSSGTPSASENQDARIDAILDKISRGGMKSLSNDEKKFLRDASDRMNRTKH